MSSSTPQATWGSCPRCSTRFEGRPPDEAMATMLDSKRMTSLFGLAT